MNQRCSAAPKARDSKGPSRISAPPRGVLFGGKTFDFENVAGVRGLFSDFGISPSPPTAAEFTRRVAQRREK